MSEITFQKIVARSFASFKHTPVPLSMNKQLKVLRKLRHFTAFSPWITVRTVASLHCPSEWPCHAKTTRRTQLGVVVSCENNYENTKDVCASSACTTGCQPSACTFRIQRPFRASHSYLYRTMRTMASRPCPSERPY